MKKYYCAVSFYRYIYFRFKPVVLIITGWSLFFVSAFVLSYLLQSNVFFYLFYGLSNVVFVLPFIALFYGYRSARDTVLIDPFLRCKDFIYVVSIFDNIVQHNESLIYNRLLDGFREIFEAIDRVRLVNSDVYRGIVNLLKVLNIEQSKEGILGFSNKYRKYRRYIDVMTIINIVSSTLLLYLYSRGIIWQVYFLVLIIVLVFVPPIIMLIMNEKYLGIIEGFARLETLKDPNTKTLTKKIIEEILITVSRNIRNPVRIILSQNYDLLVPIRKTDVGVIYELQPHSET